MENLSKRSSLLSFIKKRREGREKEKSFVTCESCNEKISQETFRKNFNVCPKCNFHSYLHTKDRMELIFDEYKIISEKPKYDNPIDFKGYREKLKENKEKSNLREGLTCARGKINGNDAVVIILDRGFLMGSMGSYVGEEITKAFEFATKKRLPVIAFTASGGARMQEGIISLMQMAKTSNAVREHSNANLLFINVFTHPTTGGVTASFASLSDISLSEPKALIGFAGPRVIKQTIGQELPEGFQRAEFQEDHGFLDLVVQRKELKNKLSKILSLHWGKNDSNYRKRIL